MRIVFYGTPVFAVTSLEKIILNGFDVVAVVTSPDKEGGRGMHTQQSAVKQCAIKYNIQVLQPPNLKSPEFINQLKRLKPDIQVIIAFRMLPEMVWSLPPLGSINLHASLLPNYRGAAPINRAIMNGETKTGLTTFFLKHEIDTGNILMQKKADILPDDDAGTLHDRLMNIGADLIVETLKRIKQGNAKAKPQPIAPHHNAPKIFTEDCEIEWNRSVIEIHNQVRGLSPYPGAFTTYQNKILKIFKGHFELTNNKAEPGVFMVGPGRLFRISGIDGWYYPAWVQPEGKRKMPVQDFVNGLKKG